MLDRNLGIENELRASIEDSNSQSLYHHDPRLRNLCEDLREGLSDGCNGILSEEDLMLIHVGKVQSDQDLVPRSTPYFLVLMRQHEREGQFHWVRVGICSWSAAFGQFPSTSLFSGICW